MFKLLIVLLYSLNFCYGEECWDSYLPNDVLGDCLKYVSKSYPNLASVFEVGKSTSGLSIWGIQLTENITGPQDLKPSVKLVANLHGDETVGRELLANLTRHLVNNYGSDNRITKLLHSTRIFIVPSLNPDGFSASQVRFIFWDKFSWIQKHWKILVI